MKLLWWSAWSTYEEEFQDQLKTMGAVSEQAAQHWCRAYFDTVCKNFTGENNFTVIQQMDSRSKGKTYNQDVGRY